MFHATLVSLLIGWQGRLRVASLSEISEFWFRLTLDASNAGIHGGSAPPAASRHKGSEGWKHKAGSDVKEASASLGWLVEWIQTELLVLGPEGRIFVFFCQGTGIRIRHPSAVVSHSRLEWLLHRQIEGCLTSWKQNGE